MRPGERHLQSPTRLIKDTLLEQYLADALDEQTKARLEELLAGSPEDRARLEELREASAAFLAQHPPEEWAERILRGSARSSQEGSRPDRVARRFVSSQWSSELAAGPDTAPEDAASSREPPLLGKDGSPQRFGDYELIKALNQGGMGIVYKARHVLLQRTVALKMIAEEKLASTTYQLLFLEEAKAVASLDHPNIVPIYEVGEHEGHHYFTMKLMEGGSLAEQIRRFHGRPRSAARLLATVARAVHYGHQRGILHRDLKPANLLLDARDVPHVADFGLAWTLGNEESVTRPDPGGGTRGYMAPEQRNPSGKPLSVAADIYSLGVILYELLTGRLPFDPERREQEPRPPAPRLIDPRIPRVLEAICLKCLEKEPERRYGTAEELGDDLDRFLQGKPIWLHGPHERAGMWILRHPLGVTALATLLWFVLVIGLGVQLARAQAEDLRRNALGANVFAAQLAAPAVLLELTQLSGAVEHSAALPELVAALQAHDPMALESFCKDRFAYYDDPHRGLRSPSKNSPFDIWFILDTAGRAIARWPQPEREFIGRNYEWRDYFLGAQRLAAAGQRTAYISRVLISESNGKYTFALSAPVYAADGTWIGVLAATVASDSTLGALRLHAPGDSSRIATLVALTDRSREQATLPARDVYTVLVHGQLGHGMTASLEAWTSRRIAQALPEALPAGAEPLSLSEFRARTLEGYRDPVTNDPGPWLATFAPVGRTGFAVIMQTREDAVVMSDEQLARRIAWWSLPFALSTALVWLAFWWFRYRSSTAQEA